MKKLHRKEYVIVPIKYFKGVYNKISVLADMELNRDIVYRSGRVAFVYATLSAYSEGLTDSEYRMLGIGMDDVSRAFQLGIVKCTNDGRYQAVPYVYDDDCLRIESKFLKADLEEISLEAKEYYVWSLCALKSRDRQVEGNVFLGTIEDLFSDGGDVNPAFKGAFEDIRIDSLAKLDPLFEYDLLEMYKEGEQFVELADIIESNKEMKVVFRVNVLGEIELPEQVLEAPRVIRVGSKDGKSRSAFSDFLKIEL